MIRSRPPFFVLLVVVFLVLVLPLGTSATAQTQSADAGDGRWWPEACRFALEGLPGPGSGETAEARWNRAYREGIDAYEARDPARAEIAFCRALRAARAFGPGDVRFAETLDELGLVSYERGDMEQAEAMQGAAVTERLLAVGAPEAERTEEEAHSCLSSVGTYVQRLGWILEQQGRLGEHHHLSQEPYRILERRYVPDAVVLERIDPLISTYLLVENYAAADWLTEWRDELRSGGLQ